jgi:hypothetical protein
VFAYNKPYLGKYITIISPYLWGDTGKAGKKQDGISSPPALRQEIS